MLAFFRFGHEFPADSSSVPSTKKWALPIKKETIAASSDLGRVRTHRHPSTTHA